MLHIVTLRYRRANIDLSLQRLLRAKRNTKTTPKLPRRSSGSCCRRVFNRRRKVFAGQYIRSGRAARRQSAVTPHWSVESVSLPTGSSQNVQAEQFGNSANSIFHTARWKSLTESIRTTCRHPCVTNFQRFELMKLTQRFDSIVSDTR
jgi:hypothetical protein